MPGFAPLARLLWQDNLAGLASLFGFRHKALEGAIVRGVGSHDGSHCAAAVLDHTFDVAPWRIDRPVDVHAGKEQENGNGSGNESFLHFGLPNSTAWRDAVGRGLTGRIFRTTTPSAPMRLLRDLYS